MNTQNHNPAKARRKPGSFVLKLTLSQTMRMLWVMLAVDLMLAAAFTGLTLFGLERYAARFDGLSPAEAEALSGGFSGVTFSQVEDPGRSLWLHHSLEQWLDLPQDAVRWLSFEDSPGEPFLRNREVKPVYSVFLPAEDGGYLRVAFDLRLPARWFLYALGAILLLELLMLISHTSATRRAVRRTLAPIQQLADAARSISADPAARRPEQKRGREREQKRSEEREPRRQQSQQRREELKLSGTIDTLNKINANRLDTRIPVEGERQELRGLASAINSMLDRLDASYRSQLRFVSDASHELRTPIAVLQGYANMLDRWGKDDPEVLQESIDAIKAEAEGMKALVEQLLFLARSDNDSIEFQVTPLNFADYADDLQREYRLIHRGYTFAADIEDPLWVEGDGGLLKQAVRIFVDNAVKYSPDGGRIAISAKAVEGEVRVSVTDNGIGIPPEDLPHVFERFYRSDESRARATGGTGLGLSIAQWIVERHGGHVEIVSREELGTRLTMVLPRAEAPAEPVEDAV